MSLTRRKDRQGNLKSQRDAAREPYVKTTPHRIGFLGVIAAGFLSCAAPAAAAGDFNSVVRAVLDNQKSGQLAEMDSATRAKMTDCVIQALQPLPDGFKRKITDGKTLAEQQHAFGEVVQADHAKWKQNIAKACSDIATAN